MRTVKSDAFDDLASVISTIPSASEVLKYWELDFTFDMDHGNPSSLNSRKPRRLRSASTSNLIQSYAQRMQHADDSRVSK